MPARTLFEVQLAPLMCGLSPTVYLAAYVAFLIALSLAVHLIIERPARRWIKARFQEKRNAAPATDLGETHRPLLAPAD